MKNVTSSIIYFDLVLHIKGVYSQIITRLCNNNKYLWLIYKLKIACFGVLIQVFVFDNLTEIVNSLQEMILSIVNQNDLEQVSDSGRYGWLMVKER